MTLPASGAISLSGVNTELGYSSTAQISLNDSAVRTLAGKSSGAISLDDLHGKSNTFSFTISSNTADVNLRTAALAAGWNGSAVLYATIASGVVVYSTSTSNAALTVSGSFPNGVYLTNSGTILGKGGDGGSAGYGPYPSAGGAGGAGGAGMAVSSAISITNNGRISGGGGGGAGGQGETESTEGGVIYYYGGAGGGGIGNGSPNGTLTSAGNGAAAPIIVGQVESGGNGGTYGTAGQSRSNAAGGAAGACLTGNSYITWLATGTRNGTIS